jgi:hypothetical protein
MRHLQSLPEPAALPRFEVHNNEHDPHELLRSVSPSGSSVFEGESSMNSSVASHEHANDTLDCSLDESGMSSESYPCNVQCQPACLPPVSSAHGLALRESEDALSAFVASHTGNAPLTRAARRLFADFDEPHAKQLALRGLFERCATGPSSLRTVNLPRFLERTSADHRTLRGEAICGDVGYDQFLAFFYGMVDVDGSTTPLATFATHVSAGWTTKVDTLKAELDIEHGRVVELEDTLQKERAAKGALQSAHDRAQEAMEKLDAEISDVQAELSSVRRKNAVKVCFFAQHQNPHRASVQYSALPPWFLIHFPGRATHPVYNGGCRIVRFTNFTPK